MNDAKNPAWNAARGEKWRTHLTGMEAMLAAVDEPLIDALALADDRPQTIADLGCGGGDTTQKITHRASAGSAVSGFDLSPALVAHARARASLDERAPRFEVADLAFAEPPAAAFDRLVSRFGVMFFPDAPKAFANLARWLAPEGRFAFAVWGPLEDNPWLATAQDEIARVTALPRVEDDAPGPFRYARVDRLLTMLSRAGFADLGVERWRGALPIGGGLPPAEAATFALAAFSSFAELLASAGPSATDEAHRALTETYARHTVAGVVRLGAHVQIVTGTRA